MPGLSNIAATMRNSDQATCNETCRPLKPQTPKPAVQTSNKRSTWPNLPPFITTKQAAPTPHDNIHSYNIDHTIFHGRAKGTHTNHASAVRTYKNWCDTHKIHKNLQFLVTKYVLCAFAASFLGTRSGTTVNGLLVGIKAWHTAHNAPWNTSARLSLVTHSVATEASEKSTRPPRQPVTPHMLELLKKHLCVSDAFDMAVLAAALVAFWGQCRFGKLFGTSKLKNDATKYPSRSSIGPAVSANGS